MIFNYLLENTKEKPIIEKSIKTLLINNDIDIINISTITINKTLDSDTVLGHTTIQDNKIIIELYFSYNEDTTLYSILHELGHIKHCNYLLNNIHVLSTKTIEITNSTNSAKKINT